MANNSLESLRKEKNDQIFNLESQLKKQEISSEDRVSELNQQLLMAESTKLKMESDLQAVDLLLTSKQDL